jgi:hypothetical protein
MLFFLSRLKKSLALPSFFLDRPEMSVCYCDTCHKVIKQKQKTNKSGGLKRYL